MSAIWRPYQQECFKAIKTKYKDGIRKQLVVSATGTGKRLMAVNTIRWFPGRTLFLAHREELIEQAMEEIDKYFPLQVGIIKANRFEIDKRIVVASAQTIHRRLDRIPEDYFENIIVDEAHHYSSITFRKSLDYFKPRLVTGWSATPTRMDNLSLSDIFEEIVYTYDIKNGILDGFLCELDGIRISSKVDLSNVHKVAGDFNQKELSIMVDTPDRNRMIVEKYKEYALGRQAVVYGVDIDHAEHLTKAFREAGFRCETVVSDETITSDRSGVNKAFKNKEIDILSNVNILTEGWDYSDVGCIIMARPTQSKALYLQCVGRGTRLKSPDFVSKFGQKCIILDVVDNTRKHSLVNTWTLDQENDAVEKVFTTREKKDKIAAERQARMMKIVKEKGDTKLNLLRLPKVVVSDSARMDEPATEKQIAWLIAEGVYDPESSYTKRQASEFISNFPATEKQVWALKKMGYDVSKGVTMGQASAAFQAQNANKSNLGNVTPVVSR